MSNRANMRKKIYLVLSIMIGIILVVSIGINLTIDSKPQSDVRVTPTDPHRQAIVNELNNDIWPKIVEYNKTKEEQISNFTVKGKKIDMYAEKSINTNGGPFHYDNSAVHDMNELTGEATLIFPVNSEKNLLTTQNYPYTQQGEGEPVKSSVDIDVKIYQEVTDWVIIYYPEKKIVGWKRTYGSTNIPEAISRWINDEEGGRTYINYAPLP